MAGRVQVLDEEEGYLLTRPTGDGEISFGGKQDVSNLMNALEGAAINAATGAGVANTANAAATNTVAGGSGPITIAPPDSTLSDQVSTDCTSKPSRDRPTNQTLFRTTRPGRSLHSKAWARRSPPASKPMTPRRPNET